jgi:hypothetical protein
MAIELVVNSLLDSAGVGGLPRVLVGKTLGSQAWKESYKKATEAMIEHGTRKMFLTPPPSHFDKVLVPVYVDPHRHDMVVFDVGMAGSVPYIKAWDPTHRWKGVMPALVPALVPLSMGPLPPKAKVNFLVSTATDGPSLPNTNSSGPFAFFTVAHLALGKSAPAIGEVDEGFVRSYMWACVREGKLLPLPRCEFVD